ncbi:MAG: hypothetical protein U1F37_04215 [Alphaproteobacteria bacterium]
MKTLRNLAIAGTLAIAAAVSSGAANAAPASSLDLGVAAPTTAESAIAPAHHFHHRGRLCYVPFFKLVQWFGYWQARSIKYRCYYNYQYYNY